MCTTNWLFFMLFHLFSHLCPLQICTLKQPFQGNKQGFHGLSTLCPRFRWNVSVLWPDRGCSEGTTSRGWRVKNSCYMLLYRDGLFYSRGRPGRVSGMGGDRFRNLVLAHWNAAQLFHDCLRNLTQLKVLLPQTLHTASWRLNIMWGGVRLAQRVMIRSWSTAPEGISQLLWNKSHRSYRKNSKQGLPRIAYNASQSRWHTVLNCSDPMSLVTQLCMETNFSGKSHARQARKPGHGLHWTRNHACIWHEEPAWIECPWCPRHVSRTWDSIKLQLEMAKKIAMSGSKPNVKLTSVTTMKPRNEMSSLITSPSKHSIPLLDNFIQQSDI